MKVLDRIARYFGYMPVHEHEEVRRTWNDVLEVTVNRLRSALRRAHNLLMQREKLRVMLKARK